MNHAENMTCVDASQACAPAMARSAENSAQNAIQDIIKDIDYLLSPPGASPRQSFIFHLDGIPFEVQRKEQEHGPLVQIQAVLGFLPYSAESAERRGAILQILHESKKLMNTRFGLDRGGKILVVGQYADQQMVAPDFMFFPLMKFMQEARPFIDLIGRHL